MTAAAFGVTLLLGCADLGSAEPVAPHAEVKRVVGRVEVLRKGQPQWVPAVIGDHLVEGDDIRAFAGAQAELALPDTSTVVLVENSRILLTKLEFDPQTQSRLFLFHLAVGKVRATVAQAALTPARIRQSNFAISTPTAVAAARGTINVGVHRRWHHHDRRGTRVWFQRRDLGRRLENLAGVVAAGGARSLPPPCFRELRDGPGRPYAAGAGKDHLRAGPGVRLVQGGGRRDELLEPPRPTMFSASYGRLSVSTGKGS